MPKRWPRLLLPYLGLYLLAFAWRTRELFIDDAYIGFRYLDNLLHGHGFVFNPGERVEGVTNLGWLLALLPGGLVAPLPAVAKLLGLVAAVVALVCAWQVAADGETDAAAALPVPFIVAGSFSWLYFSLAGMEVGFLSALLGLLTVEALADRRRPYLVALGAAYAFLVRPETVVWYPLALLLAGRRAGWKGPAAVWLAAIVGLTGARCLLFGSPLPNTFLSKIGVIHGPADTLWQLFVLLRGATVNVGFPVTGLCGLLLTGLGFAGYRNRRPEVAARLLAAVLTGLAIAVYAPDDWTGLPRYFAPYLPAAVVLLWRGLADAVGLAVPGRRGRLIVVAAAVGLAYCGVMGTGVSLREDNLRRYPGFVWAGRSLVEPSRWVGEHTEPDAVIACRRIGALAYFSHRRVFDYRFGLTDPDIAKLIRRTGVLAELGSPHLAGVWRARAPGYLLEDGDPAERVVEVYGWRYELVRAFAVGEGVDWCLYRRAR